MAKVGIVMGSDSDMPVMAKAADILEQLGISYEMTIISAHPAFQEGDDALKQGAPEFRPVEQQRHNLGAGFRVASGERVEQDQCRAGRQIRQ